MLWLLSQGRWIEWVERSDPGSCKSEFCRWPNEPRASRSVVEAPCCTGRGAVEALPSGVPRTSRSWSAVEALRRAGLVRDGPSTRSRRAAFCCGLIVLFFYYRWLWVPIVLVPTQNKQTNFLSHQHMSGLGWRLDPRVWMLVSITPASVRIYVDAKSHLQNSSEARAWDEWTSHPRMPIVA
jgi:hypothetical protein